MNKNVDTYEGNPVGGWPGTEYCGLKFAKFAAAAAKPGKLPALKPGGNWLITWARKIKLVTIFIIQRYVEWHMSGASSSQTFQTCFCHNMDIC